MRNPSLVDILCVLIVAGAVLFIASNGITLGSLVIAVIVVVLLIMFVRWALGGARGAA